MLSRILTVIIGGATLAFGAVYPWGYWPLFGVAAGIGIVGLLRERHGEGLHRRRLVVTLVAVSIAILVQIAPITQGIQQILSPRTAPLADEYRFGQTAGSGRELSLAPRATLVAAAAFAALAMYAIGCSALLGRHDLRSLPLNLTMFAVPLALFGIVSHERNNGLVYWFWKPIEGGGSDAFGPFVNRNHFAGWMLMATCLSIGALLGELERLTHGRRNRWRQQLISSRSATVYAVVLLFAAIVTMTMSLVWTRSRSGILAFGIGIASFFWLLASRRQMAAARKLAAGALASAVTIAFWSRGVLGMLGWFSDSRDLLGRFGAWRDAWSVFTNFPIAGTGLNTYSIAMLFYQRSNPGFHLNQAHNDYLQLLAEGGLLVAIPAGLSIAALAAAVAANLRTARQEVRGYWIRAGAAVGLLAVGIQESAEFSLQIPANAFLFCTLVAVALAPVPAAARDISEAA